MISANNKIQAYIAWFVATTFVFFQFFLQTSTSIFTRSWVSDFHLNEIELSNLSAAFYYSYVLMQIPVGILYDRFKAKNILIIAAALVSSGCFVLAAAKNYELAIIGRILMGIGSSFGFIGMLKIIINNFKINEFAFMLGLSEALSMSVITFGVILLAFILKFYSWRLIMIVCGVFAMILFFAIIFFLHERPSSHTPAKVTLFEILIQIKSIISNKQIMLCSMYGFFMFSLINVFTSLWGVDFITNTYNFSRELASSMVSVVFIGVAIGGPLNGLLSKRLGNHTKIMRYGALFAFITSTMVILVPGLSEVIIFIILFLGGVFCSMYVQALSIIKDSVTYNVQATALATSNTLIMASAPILQVLIGSLLNNNVFGIADSNVTNYRLSLAILPIGMLIAFLMSLFINEPKKHVVIHNIS